MRKWKKAHITLNDNDVSRRTTRVVRTGLNGRRVRSADMYEGNFSSSESKDCRRTGLYSEKAIAVVY